MLLTPTPIKHYAQLLLLIENEYQTRIEFYCIFPSQTPLLLVHQVRPHFGFLLPAPGSRCPAACQTRTRTEESARSPRTRPRARILDVPSAARSVGQRNAPNVPRSAALNCALINPSAVHHVDRPWPARDPAQPARAPCRRPCAALRPTRPSTRALEAHRPRSPSSTRATHEHGPADQPHVLIGRHLRPALEQVYYLPLRALHHGTASLRE